MLERDVSEDGVVFEEGERRAVLWDCKREALRGLGVNIGEEKQPRHCYELGLNFGAQIPTDSNLQIHYGL